LAPEKSAPALPKQSVEARTWNLLAYPTAEPQNVNRLPAAHLCAASRA